MVLIQMEAPVDWQQTIENIRKVRQKFPAPVDTMGCAQIDQQKDINQRFRVLVSLMLSSQTKDQVTWAAVQRLKEHNLCNAKAIVEAQEKDIEDLIYPVGFYRRKAVYLKKVAQILANKYECDIPNSVESLCELPGVGPKMAHLCMVEAWNIVTGIGVDTHVHRISARLGWVPSKGIKTPEDTRKALESWLPRDYWREINLLLVGFGQTICTPVRPKCPECYNSVICPSSSVTTAGAKNIKVEKETVSEKVEGDEVKEGELAVAAAAAKTKAKTKMKGKAKVKVKVKAEVKTMAAAVKVEDNEDTKPKVRASRVVKKRR